MGAVQPLDQMIFSVSTHFCFSALVRQFSDSSCCWFDKLRISQLSLILYVWRRMRRNWCSPNSDNVK